MPARGSRRDSRSRRSPSYRRRSPSYRRDDRRGGGGDRGRSRRGSRSRSGGRGGSRYSPPPRRTPPRDRRFSRSRSRREREAQKRREAEKKKMEKRIPPPAVRGPDKPQITEEHKANSVEFNGRYYATIDFTPPNSGGDSAGQKARIQMPYGWEVADITDDVRDAVVKLYTFGTDLVVGEGGKAFHTAKGARPGALEMIWDYKKDMGMYNLHQDGSLSNKNGRQLGVSGAADTSIPFADLSAFSTSQLAFPLLHALFPAMSVISGWSFLDEPGFFSAQKEDKSRNKDLKQGTDSDQQPVSTQLNDPAQLTPLQTCLRHPLRSSDMEDEFWEGSSSSSSSSMCSFVGNTAVRYTPQPPPSWIGLGHPNAKLVLGLLGGRAEDEWE
ncbi:unnamed protein product [Symbiodinium microadriaticum]|nr:unnamed protein product [Symbiodinium microadriaticum]CAE7206631.1 unnamed protein product [Symbiodinium sp. KB8]